MAHAAEGLAARGRGVGVAAVGMKGWAAWEALEGARHAADPPLRTLSQRVEPHALKERKNEIMNEYALGVG